MIIEIVTETVSMNLQLLEMGKAEKPILKKWLIPYFLEIDPEKIIRTDKEPARVDYPYLELYWKDNHRMPFKIMELGESAGFILVNKWIEQEAFGADWAIAEFYVFPKFRRKGVGRKAVFLLLQLYPGKWEIRTEKQNKVAISFWEQTLRDFGENRLLMETDAAHLFFLLK